MKKTIVLVAAAGAALALSGAVYAGDAAAGKEASSKCSGCHGADGKGKPPIAGMAEGDFTTAMNAYKSGDKKHMMMNTLAKKLSDDDIANLAAYYSTLPK